MRENATEHSGRIIMVVGMQYGSEGKGAITSYLTPGISLGVRTGAANAGHTIYHRNQPFVMRQIPCAWTNPLAQLVLGRGAIISLDILLEEIKTISKFSNIKNRLFIDHSAHVITKAQIQAEQKTDLALRIGSTSATSKEGIGTATADKVLRKESCLQAKDVPELENYLADTVDLINSSLDQGKFALLEGTQGFKLDLDFGYFPFVTSRNTTATALATQAGVSTHLFDIEVIGVTRTYPIRVAGNSGPFDDDSQEITWAEVTKQAKSKTPISEQTSVTKKIRRVATFSHAGFIQACQINRPTEIALTFADYLDWSAHEKDKITPPIEKFIDQLEELSNGIPVNLVKTGPQTTIDFNWYRRSMLRKI